MLFMFTGRADDKWDIYQDLFEPSQEIRVSKWDLSWKRALRTILKLCSTRCPDARWHQESPCQQVASVQVGSANWIHDGAHKLTWPPATLKIQECSEWPWKLITEGQPAGISVFSYGIENEQQWLRAEKEAVPAGIKPSFWSGLTVSDHNWYKRKKEETQDKMEV